MGLRIFLCLANCKTCHSSSVTRGEGGGSNVGRVIVCAYRSWRGAMAGIEKLQEAGLDLRVQPQQSCRCRLWLGGQGGRPDCKRRA